MPRTAPSLLDLDILRAALGPSVAAPYVHAFGASPWLTAGTLTWHAGDADDVLHAWPAWIAQLPPTAPAAVRVGARVAAIDVALIGDPWGAATRLAALRELGPVADTVGIAAPAALMGRRGGAPARVAAASAPLPVLPPATALLDVAPPEGICLGLRHDPAGGPAAIALGIVADAPRLEAAVARLERGLGSSARAA